MFVLLLFTVLSFIASDGGGVYASTPLTPQLSCWFNSYDNQTRNTHLVIGYENTDLTNTLIYVQQGSTVDPLKNIITPLEYNGLQQDLFRTGVHPFDFEILDRLQIIQSGASISWSLGTVVLTIRASDLTPENICQARYPNNCPLWIPNFCNDASFCNGHEVCAPKFMRQVTQERFGVCQSAVRIVSCEPGTVCNENLIGCVQPPTEAPTEAPTTATTTTISEEPPSVVIVQPIPVGECSTNLECASKQTFCLGTSSCIENKCVFNENYDACSTSNGRNGTVVAGKGLLMNMCSEESRLCISYYSCSTNAHCDDGLVCTGIETCSTDTNICQPGSPVQCADSSILCSEATGCGPHGILTDEDNITIVVVVPTNAPTMAPTTNSSTIPPPPTTNTALVIFALAFSAIALIIFIGVIFFIIRSQNNRIAAISSASTTMQSRIK